MNDVPSMPNAPNQSSVRISQVAVWSLVLGILSNLCLWLLGSIPAIILGIVAIKKINRDPLRVGGKGLAIAGIITGCSGVILGMGVASVFFIGVTAYQRGSDKATCILQRVTVQKLVITQANSKGLQDGDQFPVDLLVSEGMIAEIPACPAGGSYTFLGRVPDSSTSYVKCDHEMHMRDFNQQEN